MPRDAPVNRTVCPRELSLQERDSVNKRDIGDRMKRRAKFPQGQKSKEMERDSGNYSQVDGQGRLPGGDSNQQLWGQRHRAYLHSTAWEETTAKPADQASAGPYCPPPPLSWKARGLQEMLNFQLHSVGRGGHPGLKLHTGYAIYPPSLQQNPIFVRRHQHEACGGHSESGGCTPPLRTRLKSDGWA